MRGAGGAAALDDFVLSLATLPSESVRIAIAMKTRGAGSGASLDLLVGGPVANQLAFAANVPEPRTLALLALAGLATRSRRPRRAGASPRG